MTLATVLPPQPKPLSTEGTRSVPAIRPIRPPRRGQAIPCRGAQSADGLRGAAQASEASRFEPGNTAALNHGSRWILDHAADAPLPASTSPDTKKRILDMRSALAEAWTATPHASTPLGGFGLAVITRLATAMICLDADAANDLCGYGKDNRLAATRQLTVLLSRLGREMSRWGLIWGPWATQASPAPVSPPQEPPASSEPAPADTPDANPEPIASPQEPAAPKQGPSAPAAAPESTPSTSSIPSTSENEKTGRSPAGPCPAGRSPDEGIITVIRRAPRDPSSAARGPLISVSRFPMKVNDRGGIVSPSLPGMEAWSADMPRSAVAIPAGGLSRRELSEARRLITISQGRQAARRCVRNLGPGIYGLQSPPRDLRFTRA